MTTCILKAHPVYDALSVDDFKSVINLLLTGKMSAYENVVGGKLKLKGKALDVKAAGIKKKKKHKKHQDQISLVTEKELSAGRFFC